MVCAMAAILTACERSPYAGYKVVGDDVHLHLQVIGEGETLPADSDSVRLRLRMGRPGRDAGALFSTERMYSAKELRAGAFVPVMRRLHQGDSLSVIAPASAWPWAVLTSSIGSVPADTGMVQAEISVLDIVTPAEVRADRDRLKQNEPLVFEHRLIAAYRQRSALPFVRWGTSEVYHHITRAAVDTNALATGDQVTISYQGRRLEDGQVFDDTRKNGAPLIFTIGDKDQVINGIEVALLLLREGQEGIFIFPSQYAFGAKGIPGVLEPYMPVEYTVRLEHVERSSTR